MSIHRRSKQAHKFKVKQEFEDNKYLPKTYEGLLDFLFDEDSDYIIYYYDDPYDKSTLSSRLWTLVLLPIWFVCSPFLWIFTGDTGINEHSKLGKWIAKVTKL